LLDSNRLFKILRDKTIGECFGPHVSSPGSSWPAPSEFVAHPAMVPARWARVRELHRVSRRAVALSKEEARALKHDHVDPHHLLLGVLTAEHATAGVVLGSLGVDAEGGRRQVVALSGQGENAPSGRIAFSTAGKKIFEYSVRESLELGHTYIGTEHLVLRTDAVRKAVMVRLGSAGGAEPTVQHAWMVELLD
jgi:ATP-dependent Clp protease ATP-binding subunit ClpA